MSGADVVIIDSGGANLASLRFAFQRLGAQSLVSADPAVVSTAPRAVLPGVGAAADAMARLGAAGLPGTIRALRQPLLGICLGMQLLYDASEEGDTPGLGLIAGTVRRLRAAPSRPVPHMGWNRCAALRPEPLLAGLGADAWFYFLHGYAAPPGEATCATVQYGATLSAAVRSGNFLGVQFHPERSGSAGARVLRNFLEL